MLRNEECLRVKQWVVPAVNNNPLRQCGTSSLPSHYPLLTLLYSVYTDYTRHETILYPLLSPSLLLSTSRLSQIDNQWINPDSSRSTDKPSVRSTTYYVTPPPRTSSTTDAQMAGTLRARVSQGSHKSLDCSLPNIDADCG